MSPPRVGSGHARPQTIQADQLPMAATAREFGYVNYDIALNSACSSWRLEDELPPDGAVPGPLVLALSSRTRLGTVERAKAIAAATLPAEAQRRLTVMPIEITTGYRRPDGQWPPRCPVACGARVQCPGRFSCRRSGSA